MSQGYDVKYLRIFEMLHFFIQAFGPFRSEMVKLIAGGMKHP